MIKKRLRFTLRILLLLTAIAAIPCWWIQSELTAFRAEQAALQRIREVAPELYVEFIDITPSWLIRVGVQPAWLQRVDQLDVTGITGGRDFSLDEIPLQFDDGAFSAIRDDLQEFDHLKSLYLQFTRVTDTSIPKLRAFDNLRYINLQQTGATTAVVKNLETEMPSTKISFFHDLKEPWK